MSERDELARIVNAGLRNGVTLSDLLLCQCKGDNSIGEYIAEAIEQAGYRKQTES
jgi:hypothetical protein